MMKAIEEMGFIQLPNNLKLIPAAVSFTAKIAEIIGFSPEDATTIQMAVEEACMNVINNSFVVDETADFDLHFLKKSME